MHGAAELLEYHSHCGHAHPGTTAVSRCEKPGGADVAQPAPDFGGRTDGIVEHGADVARRCALHEEPSHAGTELLLFGCELEVHAAPVRSPCEPLVSSGKAEDPLGDDAFVHLRGAPGYRRAAHADPALGVRACPSCRPEHDAGRLGNVILQIAPHELDEAALGAG